MTLKTRTPLVTVLITALSLAACTHNGSSPQPVTSQAMPVKRMSPDEGKALLTDNAKQKRDYWKSKSFEEFEAKTYHEPFEGGKYIVNGDTPILNKKQLKEYFETQIKSVEPSPRRTALLNPKLVVNRENDEDTVWNSVEKQQLTYCVSKTFGNRYENVVADMKTAGDAWATVADIKFVHVAAQDDSCTAGNPNVTFDVRPVNVSGEYLARAFFPNEPRGARNVLIDDSSFQLNPAEKLKLVGILRHELGHTLGFRHEHTRPDAGKCFEDSNWRPLTNYDPLSVMHYPQCNGLGDWSLTLTGLDQNGAACLYGAAQGFQVDSAICPAGPNPPTPAPCGVKTETFANQQIATGAEKQYGPFPVAANSLFEAKMVGQDGTTGDPDLYVRFGQAPNRMGSGYDCRPYLSGAEESCSLDVPSGPAQAFVMVHGYSAGRYNLAVSHVPPTH